MPDLLARVQQALDRDMDPATVFRLHADGARRGRCLAALRRLVAERDEAAADAALKEYLVAVRRAA